MAKLAEVSSAIREVVSTPNLLITMMASNARNPNLVSELIKLVTLASSRVLSREWRTSLQINLVSYQPTIRMISALIRMCALLII